MTDLRQLLAFNIKQNRRKLGISQSHLSKRADASTQYIAMIELGRKFPSVKMIERLASALELDSLDLFSPPPLSSGVLQKLQEVALDDMERAIAKAVGKAVQKSVSEVVSAYMMEIKD